MRALGDAGWDHLLEAMGTKFGVNSLTNFYPSFIAMTQSQYSHMHSDSDHPNLWNVIFPTVQSNATNSAGIHESELILGRDADWKGEPLNVPYKYEPDHAVALGLNGMHGVRKGNRFLVDQSFSSDFGSLTCFCDNASRLSQTAPVDYRGTDTYRIVVSVYMGDFTDEKMLDEYVKNWNDPPYPRREKLRESLRSNQHWNAKNKEIRCVDFTQEKV